MTSVYYDVFDSTRKLTWDDGTIPTTYVSPQLLTVPFPPRYRFLTLDECLRRGMSRRAWRRYRGKRKEQARLIRATQTPLDRYMQRVYDRIAERYVQQFMDALFTGLPYHQHVMWGWPEK